MLRFVLFEVFKFYLKCQFMQKNSMNVQYQQFFSYQLCANAWKAALG